MHDCKNHNLLPCNNEEKGVRKAVEECVMNRFIDSGKPERIPLDSFQALFRAQQQFRAEPSPAPLIEIKAAGETVFASGRRESSNSISGFEEAVLYGFPAAAAVAVSRQRRKAIIQDAFLLLGQDRLPPGTPDAFPALLSRDDPLADAKLLNLGDVRHELLAVAFLCLTWWAELSAP